MEPLKLESPDASFRGSREICRQAQCRFRVEVGEDLGEKSSAGPEGRSPAYWEVSPVTSSLVSQRALPLPGSQFHLL